MKKINLSIFSFAVFITVLLLPAFVFAQAGMPGYGRQMGIYQGGQYAHMYGYPELRLSTEQLAERNRIWTEFQNETIQVKTDIYNKHMQINSLLNAENPDIEKIRKLQNELNALQGSFAQKRIDKTVKTRNILTPEQKAVYSPCYGRGQTGMIGVKGRGYRGGGRRTPGSRCMLW